MGVTMTTPREELLVLGPQRSRVLDALAASFTLHQHGGIKEALASLGPEADRIRGVVSKPMVGLSAELIDALPKLEIVSIGGVGLELVDLELARERGIVVTTTPVVYPDVADLAVLLGLTATRRAVEGDREIRAGRWTGPMEVGRRFSLKRAGILGMGRIGRMLAPRLAAFGMKVGYYDPLPMPDLDYPSFPSEIELARESDFLFLCASGARGERDIVTAEILKALGPEGVFVNVARGWLVDEAALVDAVTTGTIRAAGLDVFDDEPNVPAALTEADNVVLTPHIASNTAESLQATDDCVIDNIRSWFTKNEAVTPVE
jgi:hydroxypyruvate reductase